MSFLKNDHFSHFYVRNSIAHVTASINTSYTCLDSQTECDKIAVDCYDDLYGSLNQKVVSALAGARVFCGQANSSFLPDSIITYGQLLTVLTRFVEPKEGYIGSFNVLDHWAAPAALTATSYGWI